MTTEEFQYKAEMKQLLHLITHSLYSHREIFLRELISNASDALNKLRFASLTDEKILGDDTDLKIKIELDEEKKTVVISDNGIGMNHDELIENIGTIAKSGTGNFVSQLTGDQKKDIEVIGRFGVGFYSVFMVAEEVTVESRSYKEEQGYRWVSKGTGSYTIETIDKAERGTKISFKLKEDAEEFSTKWRVESIIKKYSDFVSFPIVVNDEETNKSTAIWAKNKSNVTEEEYKEFYTYLANKQSDPLGTLHLSVEAPAQFHSILFIPDEQDQEIFTQRVDTHLKLYAKRVFIQDDCKELLPSWLRFVHGVVDSEDLPLNVSREVTQNSPVMQKISKYLVRKVLAELKDWATKDKEKYEKFWGHFGNILKEGLHMDFANREKLLELFRCYSSKHPDTLISLAEYLERMPEDQEEIYYAFGKSQAAIESSPNMEYFKKHDIEVLYFYDDIDDFIIPQVGTYKEKALVSVDKADLKIADDKKDDKKSDEESAEELSSTAKNKLIAYFKDILGDRVADVIESKRLVDSPCTLVAAKDGMTSHMEKMMKMMSSDFESAKKTLEVNLENPLVKQLAKIQESRPQDQMLKDCIEQLFENSCLLDGNLEDVTKLVPRTTNLMEKATELYLKSLEN